MNGRRTRKQQIITMSVIAVAIVTLSIGFAAFSTTLRISSTATVNPDSDNFSVVFSSNANTLETNDITASPASLGDPAEIANGTVPTISGLNAKFTQPGQTVTYTFYALNEGAYLAYLNYVNFNNVEGESSNKKCTPGEGATQSLVEQACNGISINVKVGNDQPVSTNQSGISNHTLSAGNSETVVVTISYNTGSVLADGPFNVTFGDIELIYSSALNGGSSNNPITPPSSATPICTAVTEANATKVITYPYDDAGNEVTTPTMNIPTGEYNIGDEYVCEVAPGEKYHFYILSENEDETLNLIMEANVSEDTEYLSQSDYVTAGGEISADCGDDCVTAEKGPITAYRVLKGATDGWSKVPDLTKTYTSSDGQYSFTMSGKARMPEQSEYLFETWWQDIRTEMAMNYFMIEVANDSINSDTLTGSCYWFMGDLEHSLGGRTNCASHPLDNIFGVRPVITVQKAHLQ